VDSNDGAKVGVVVGLVVAVGWGVDNGVKVLVAVAVGVLVKVAVDVGVAVRVAVGGRRVAAAVGDCDVMVAATSWDAGVSLAPLPHPSKMTDATTPAITSSVLLSVRK
jgi:hypothetical protein